VHGLVRPQATSERIDRFCVAASSAPPAADLRGDPRENAEIRARAELWSLRADIEREKLKAVAPYPFFGRPMRFQDDVSALQITDDGRFSYSEISTKAFDSEDVRDNCDQRHVVTYEGIFVASDPMDESTGLDQSQGSTVAKVADPEVASIEARALVRHRIEDLGGGQTRLAAVERGGPGLFRFMVTVSPFFAPEGATVALLTKFRSQAPRGKRLPYVGAGSGSRKQTGASPPRRRRQIKHTRSLAALPPNASTGTGDAFATSYAGGHSLHSRKFHGSLHGSTSTPQLLPTLSSPSKDAGPTVDDWKEFYKNRAQMIMKHADSIGNS
jgi:hypothetical protein